MVSDKPCFTFIYHCGTCSIAPMPIPARLAVDQAKVLTGLVPCIPGNPVHINNQLATMNQDECWAQIVALDQELLRGGVILSEWCSFIVREADVAFASGAHLASILTAVSGIETYLRSEYFETGKERLVELINRASLDNDLKDDLHVLRKYRNKWVHVDESWNDANLLERPEETEQELERMALFAARALRRTIYENQWV